ncbi:hypothetical protein JKF63_02260 [Porcisia hertigi]|uniref:Uncharacterized protein n=1 Tax=Porcisia hertigi TaxID=2761500 RepID=A0A836IH03_9TRYP|nr:hypothetical protein JKF63_02260 [Porcisia hertigi]
MRDTALLRVAAWKTAEVCCASPQTTLSAVAVQAVMRGVAYSASSHRRCRVLQLRSCDEDRGLHTHALRCSRACVKSRSLAPDDPFGERSSWEDPSDGIYAAWKDVDQDGFVNAAGSQEVRQAHFGPEWARFTTVGRMSVKKMREGSGTQQTPSPGGAADALQGFEGAEAVPRSHLQRYRTAEEIHEADLRQRRRLLERNYSSYEAFVEHELGGGDGFVKGELTPAPEVEVHRRDAKEELYSAVSMESEFSVLEGIDGCDRMTQRNVERKALETLEAAEVAEALPLPPFMLEQEIRNIAATPTLSPARPTRGLTPASSVTDMESPNTTASGLFPATRSSATGSSSGSVSHSASAAVDGVPASVVRKVLGVLGNPHGDSRLPLTDPIDWGTDDVILFLTVMERSSPRVEASHSPAPIASPTMDDTMCEAFRMACVTGDMLLNVVVPPRLFRLMRQWHLRRQDVVKKAWRLQREALETPVAATDGRIADDVVERAVSQSCGRLSETVQQLDSNLIQETILLCFPYAR